MNKKPLPSFITVIDIGTHKTTALTAQVIDGRARMLGFSERRTDGVVKGTVIDVEKLHASVHEVVNDLERVSNVRLNKFTFRLRVHPLKVSALKAFVSCPRMMVVSPS